MKVAVTGVKGVVGSAITGELDSAKFNITALDLPDHDAGDLDDLIKATKGHDAIIHSAWAVQYDNSEASPQEFLKSNFVNARMGMNAYEAARVNGIPRVIMASSNHAHRHDLRDSDGRIRPATLPTVPDSAYGAEKLFLEHVGQMYAVEHQIGVVCLRIGNVNKDNRPQPPSTSEDAVRWLSYRDLGQLVTKILLAPEIPDGFQVVYAVSNQNVFDWTNPFGYSPVDNNIGYQTTL